MYRSFSFILMMSVLLAPLLLSACSDENSQKPLRIGSNNWPGYEFLYLAKQKGFYKEEGVNVEIVRYGSLEDVRYGYEKGQIDVFASTIIELLMIKERTGKNPQIFLLADFSNGGDVVLADKSIKSISDFKNKTVAVEPQSLGLFMLYRVLEQAGLQMNDVKIVGMDQASMAKAIKANEIQAAISYPPNSIEIAKNQNVHQIFDSSKIPGEVIDIVSADRDLIESRKEDFAAIKRAWDKALKYAEKNPDDAYKIMAEKEGIKTSEFIDALKGIKVLYSHEKKKYIQPDGALIKAISVANKVLKDKGQLKKTYNPEEYISR